MITICRPHLSPYFRDDFPSREKRCVESLAQNVAYTTQFDSDVDVLISDTHLKIRDYDLKRVKLIVHANSGFDNLLPLKSMKLDIPVVLGNEIRAQAVCEYILSAIFGYHGKIPQLETWDKKRAFARQSLKHQKIQIVGLGHVGKLVYETLNPLCHEIYLYDPFKNFHNLKIEEADIIICAASLSRSSHLFFNNEMINKFKSTVLFINPSRGKLVEEKALIDFLASNPDAYAYLDVFDSEPCDFAQFPRNTHLSSHIAGVYPQLDQDTLHFEEKVLRDFLDLNSTAFSLKYNQILMHNNPAYLYE